MMNKGYFECVFIDGTREDFEKLCTEIDFEWNDYQDMIAFIALNYETKNFVTLQVIPKTQIKQIINHYTEEEIKRVLD